MLLSFLFIIFNSNYSFLDFIFTVFTLISTTSTLYLIYYILSRLFFSFKPTIYILSIIFTFTNIVLLTDFAIFRVWGFHINGMVLNIIFSPDAYDSLYMTTSSLLLIIFVIFILIYFQIFILKKLSKTKIPLILNKKNKRMNLILIPSLFFIIISEKLTYAVANLHLNSYILERTKVVPLYQPLLMDNFFINDMGMKRVKSSNLAINIDKVTNIKYPLKPIQLQNPKTPNIFIFGIDALRSDIVSKEVTPFIYDFSKESINFKHNISGGNCTRFGIFSIFYGINSSYWFGFLDAKKGSVLFDVLNKLNYQTSIISSVTFNWPEFRKTVFNNVQDKIKDDFKGNVLENDEQTIRYFENWIDKQNTTKPIFSFVWLDGVHARGYTKKYQKFTPDDATNDYLTVNPSERKKQFNRYKNSSLCADAKFGDFLKKLKEKGLYKNSIIILLSDHGQEFYEYGFYGHNSAYDFKQVGSPLIIHMPDIKPYEVNYMTSHLDIVPTLMQQLGVTNKISDYAHGKNLFDKNYKRECTFIGNWNENAIVCNKYTVVISDIISKSFSNEVRDSNTYKILKDYDKSYINNIILETLNENKRFSK